MGEKSKVGRTLKAKATYAKRGTGFGGWWLRKEKGKRALNAKGHDDEIEIDIVGVTVEDDM